jgi:hypothetical protein
MYGKCVGKGLENIVEAIGFSETLACQFHNMVLQLEGYEYERY